MKLGDSVKKVTDFLGIPQCEPCKERQRKLNEIGDWLSRMFGGRDERAGGVSTGESDGAPGGDPGGAGSR